MTALTGTAVIPMREIVRTPSYYKEIEVTIDWEILDFDKFEKIANGPKTTFSSPEELFSHLRSLRKSK